MLFRKEADFEEALINLLVNEKGWKDGVLRYPSEEELIDNWRKILSKNNPGIDRLNGAELTSSEMDQVLEQVVSCKTPVELNEFINGKSLSIKRDNPEDPEHLGKEVSLSIYDRQEVAGGSSCYQIAQQPQFKAKNAMLNDRRGDLMLLINGMPVIHIELKKNRGSVGEACNQIKKYSHEGVFTGIFSLVQVFVAMEPEETVYFANPGSSDKFNDTYYFHWADVKNRPINNWKDIAEHILSIPMAHKLIGFYTIADRSDGVLKVMRSYQYYASTKIADKITQIDWDDENQLGGYIWHTTGSGKTLTSFKAAQLIADSKKADKVVFLTDRIELGTQSLDEYRAFANNKSDVQGTDNTYALIDKLKSNNPSDDLIVTSIQKMSNLAEDEYIGENDLEIINRKRIVLIVDEAHRSTFGKMLVSIKHTFPFVKMFGFTGTPIFDENSKKDNTTSTVFGEELHRYTIVDGMRDGNVLGFDCVSMDTCNINAIRERVALEKTHSVSVDEVYQDKDKLAVYYEWLDDVEHPDVEIENTIPKSQYESISHKKSVVLDIAKNWKRLSYNNEFHALLATSSISDAIEYYRLFKDLAPQIRCSALFDSNIDNNEGNIFKEDGLIEILEDYNKRYDRNYTIKTHAEFKKDVSNRLGHRGPFKYMKPDSDNQVDLLIVVDQMLTGFDSKWLNTLYLDKKLKYENIIQAFSRTNRVYGPRKPFGTIKWYRYPTTMNQQVDEALCLYSGNKEVQLFVEHLDQNIIKINNRLQEISFLFEQDNIENYSKPPVSSAGKAKFTKEFVVLQHTLEAAIIQGFVWDKDVYEFENPERRIKSELTEEVYNILLKRYQELITGDDEDGNGDDGVPYEIDTYIMSLDKKRINVDYMNEHFLRFMNQIDGGCDFEDLQDVLNALHKDFSLLDQEEQKYAEIIIRDAQEGTLKIVDGNTLSDYIASYMLGAQADRNRALHDAIGVDVHLLDELIKSGVVDNKCGRLDELKETIDIDKAKEYFERKTGKKTNPFMARIDAENLLKEYLEQGGFDLE